MELVQPVLPLSKHLLNVGFEDIIICDSKGALYKGRLEGMNPVKDEIAEDNKPAPYHWDVTRCNDWCRCFSIGVSVANILTSELIGCMNRDPIVFALANPDPEITPDKAKEFGVRVIATGRSDFPNQVNNILAFPGIFRGALDVRATEINEPMKLAATYAIAFLVDEAELHDDFIIPNPLTIGLQKSLPEQLARLRSKRASQLLNNSLNNKELDFFMRHKTVSTVYDALLIIFTGSAIYMQTLFYPITFSGNLPVIIRKEIEEK